MRIASKTDFERINAVADGLESFPNKPRRCGHIGLLSSNISGLALKLHMMAGNCGLYEDGAKILDLGSGAGIPLAFFDGMGWRGYGIEQYPWQIDTCRQFLGELGVSTDGRIVEGDYLKLDLGELVFDDGTRLGDFDGIFCYNYVGIHYWNVLQKVLGREDLKPGIVCITDGPHCSYDETAVSLFEGSGFEQVVDMCTIRKTGRSSLTPEDIERFGRYLEQKESDFRKASLGY